MQEQTTLVCAAIDIGSNTLRLVVARCSSDGSSDGLVILETDEALVRIGESVNATGAISSEKTEHTIAVLHRFKALAEKHSAQPILAIATEAIRKAKNRDQFLQAVKLATDIDIQCIGGDVEAVLTFYGATYELSKTSHVPEQVAVMDIGGGSTELVFARNMDIYWHTSLSIGSGWLHDRFLLTDPPTKDDQIIARTFLRTYLDGLNVSTFPPLLFATGGSANTVLALSKRAFGLNKDDTALTHDDLLRCEGLLWAMPAEEIAQRYQLDIKRARIVSAGILILLALFDLFQLEELQISSYGIREGLALAYARYGDDWLKHALQQAQASSQDAVMGIGDAAVTYYARFDASGRQMFRERAETLVSWTADVLKHENVEAVHKMRVASRRLRAVMDAYRSICRPKVFKQVYQQVKDIADILGQARDTDVMIANLRQQLEQASDAQKPGLNWLIDSLIQYRQQHQQELAKYLMKWDHKAFLSQVEACLPEGALTHGKS
jgi:exopolyphosphatase/pppGpp-phosphohydrolase